jgi:hypothetical protein
MMRGLRAALARLEDSLIGDLIGVVALFALVPAVLFAGLVFGCAP